MTITIKDLLTNWWNSATTKYTEADFLVFEQIMNENIDVAIQLAMQQTLFSTSPNSLIQTIQSGYINEIISELPDITGNPDFAQMKRDFIVQLVKLYYSLPQNDDAHLVMTDADWQQIADDITAIKERK